MWVKALIEMNETHEVSSFSYQGLDWAGLEFTEVDHILWQNTPAVVITIVIGERES